MVCVDKQARFPSGFFVPHYLSKTGCPYTQSLPIITFSKALLSFLHFHPMKWVNFASDQLCINYASQR